MVDTKMKVLSIRQPWASIIINGYKIYEFRSWNTKFRGKVLIHASKEVEEEYLERFKSLGLEYPTSAIIGSVEITDCVKVTKEFEDELINKNELIYGATQGRAGYGFKMENVIKFEEAIPANGNLGFWDFYEPKEVLELMDNIKYGWNDESGNFYDDLCVTNYAKYKLLKPKEIIKRGTGVCWDQVEVERYYLKNNKLDIKTMFIFYEDGINDESHTFLTYRKDGKYYWFEHAWKDFRGIFEYTTEDKLIQDVKKKFVATLKSKNIDDSLMHCYVYEKPKRVLTGDEFYEHCKNGEEIKL